MDGCSNGMDLYFCWSLVCKDKLLLTTMQKHQPYIYFFIMRVQVLEERPVVHFIVVLAGLVLSLNTVLFDTILYGLYVLMCFFR
jgi:hypothetical protein